MGCAKPGRGICEKKYCFSVLNRGLTNYKFNAILTYGIISITSFAVALAWPLNNPAVTAPIIGPRTREQFTGICRCSGTDLNLMKLASSSSPSLSSICKTSTKGIFSKSRGKSRTLLRLDRQIQPPGDGFDNPSRAYTGTKLFLPQDIEKMPPVSLMRGRSDVPPS